MENFTNGEILMRHGMIAKMAKDKKWCVRTVSEALSYPRNTELQNEIRRTAIKEYGGVLVDKEGHGDGKEQ